MEEPKIIANYDDYRTELQTELEKTSEGFVRIGYLLKLARDTDILSGSDYKNYLDFAQGEFGLDKSTVSRFIRINDNYSEGGCSERLQEKYKGFGYAKLSLMLTLPDTVAEEMSPELTKSEIQEIKNEIDEEQAKSDIEHFEENAEAIMNPPTDSLVMQTIRAIGREFPDLYLDIFNEMKSDRYSDDHIKDIFKPSEPTVYSVRVPGKGKVIFILKEDGLTITEARTEIKTSVKWSEIINAWDDIIDDEILDDGEASWEKTYEEKFPEPETDKIETKAKANAAGDTRAKAAGVKEKVAPVQPKKVNIPEKKKKEAKNDTQKSENPENVSIEYSSEESAVLEGENEPSESPENRINPSEMPENAINTQCGEVSTTDLSTFEGGKNETNAINTQCAGISKETLKGYKAGLSADIHYIEKLLKEGDFASIRKKLERMLDVVNTIVNAEAGE